LSDLPKFKKIKTLWWTTTVFCT